MAAAVQCMQLLGQKFPRTHFPPLPGVLWDPRGAAYFKENLCEFSVGTDQAYAKKITVT